MNRTTLQSRLHQASAAFKSNVAKVAAGGSALVAAGLASAQSTSPGAAISAELASGKADQMLIIGAVAVMLGVLIVWAYVKRAR